MGRERECARESVCWREGGMLIFYIAVNKLVLTPNYSPWVLAGFTDYFFLRKHGKEEWLSLY